MRELRKAFRTSAGSLVEVLRGVSFALAAGEMLAIMGASGTGKSTLLHLLGGLDTADGGEINLESTDITGASVGELMRLRNLEIGFVFQFHHLLPDLTAAENVALPLLVGRTAQRDAMKRAEEMLERVGLFERSHQRIGLLSGGEQQRVAIARAVITGPRLLLADEPTGNLDARSGDEIGALLASLCRDGQRGGIIATHNERLARLCDRVLLLADGRISEERWPL